MPEGRVEPGLIQHTVGWPMDTATYGGSFLYHLDQNRVYVGFVVGLDYADPRFQPFEAFQQFKNHPSLQRAVRGRRDPRLRRAHHRRGRLAVHADARDARRAADRRRRRHAERAQDQGRAPGDPLGGARRRAPRSRRAAPRASTSAGARPRAARNCTRSATSARASGAACGSGMANGALETLTAGHSPWTLAEPRRSLARSSASTRCASPDRGWIERAAEAARSRERRVLRRQHARRIAARRT